MRMSVAIGQVDIGSVIDNPTVDLFRNAHVEAAIPGFHVKYRNVPPLRRDDDQVAVGVSQGEECIRPTGRQHRIRGYDHLADGFGSARGRRSARSRSFDRCAPADDPSIPRASR